ncbi:RuBisCO large subunit C-terminal-like domain-containing protein [Mucisphaera sp.]|uniref:RuBisCO large subunit C-terminal-like domain-containing protein n=1 Tax=Mucisphaera sp. TaxID=2913024 RepID=UPI003D0E16F9
MSVIEAVYALAGDRSEAEALAEKVALEQSVEVPRSVAEGAGIPEGTIGEVLGVEEVDGVFRARVGYADWLASGRPSQVLNLLGGNCSMLPGVRLVDVSLPDELIDRFGGPVFGIRGLREALGVPERPLLCSAIKPRGLDDEGLAAVAAAMARGGCDLIKDDHNLVDADAESFARRIGVIQRAVVEASERTGRACWYLPYLSVGPAEWAPYLAAIRRAGIRGVLVSPMLVGFDAIWHLRKTSGLLLMAHPTLAGGPLLGPDHGIDPGVLLGTMTRLVGADASIFPNAGGRFALSQATCLGLADALRGELTGSREVAGSWPTPAGGMSVERLDEQADLYGSDTCWLVGGAMLSHADGIEAGAAELRAALVERFGDRRSEVAERVSACELAGELAGAAEARTVLKRLAAGWEGRGAVAYKADDALPFAGVKRFELMGKAGEPMGFDVRYFELEPGGYTSLERHRHVHAIIAAEGEGEVEIGGEVTGLGPQDLAYIPPERVHQLRNVSATERFGFYCIVDRERDRPRTP